MRHALITALEAVVFVLATCYVFIPELRAGFVGTVLWPLALAHFGVQFWRLHASGMLSLTPTEILHSQRRPKFGLLTHAASIMAVVATAIRPFG